MWLIGLLLGNEGDTVWDMNCSSGDEVNREMEGKSCVSDSDRIEVEEDSFSVSAGDMLASGGRAVVASAAEEENVERSSV